MEERLHGPRLSAATVERDRTLPDPQYLHGELRRKGVTLQLLHPSPGKAGRCSGALDKWCHYWHHNAMASDLETLLASMRSNPQNVRFSDACRVADHYFGQPRHKGSSHHVWKMPWPGDPRVNMQNNGGKAKRYQVEQLLAAIDHLESQQSKPDAFARTPGARTKAQKKKGSRP